ncbi:hypothetical protein [Ornithinibacillus sp. 179-J 7C1 HS]|uniref:hypothetical protein n=1 Tax=Ornithinibacillus sp. 179-J 7C1 HS TaxID=3142384 RepID=UPI0039A3D5BD
MHLKLYYITHAYHFINEAIIIYLALLPISFTYYENVSIWKYMALVIGISLAYSFISKYAKNYVLYVISIPILVILFYTVGYTLLLSMLFSGLLAWRFISIRGNTFIGNEATYLGATILLTILALFIARDFEVVIYLILQIAIILLGHTFSHLFVIEPEKRRVINRFEWFKWGGFFATVILFIYLFSNTITSMTAKVWSAIGGIITLFAGGIARFFEFLGISDFFKSGVDELEPIEMGGFEEAEQAEMPSFEYTEGVDVNIILFAIFGLLLVAFIIILYKAMKEKGKEVVQDDSRGFELREEEIVGNQSFTKKSSRKRGKKPTNPIRRLVYDFEKKAAKLELGRLSHESIENWFKRLGLEADLQIYQKVRYGEMNSSPEEEVEFRNMLKDFEKELVKYKENESK